MSHLTEHLHEGSTVYFRRLQRPPFARAWRKLGVFVNELDFPAGSEVVDAAGDQ